MTFVKTQLIQVLALLVLSQMPSPSAFGANVEDLYAQALEVRKDYDISSGSGHTRNALDVWSVALTAKSAEFYRLMAALRGEITNISDSDVKMGWMKKLNALILQSATSNALYSGFWNGYRRRLHNHPARSVELMFTDGPNSAALIQAYCSAYAKAFHIFSENVVDAIDRIKTVFDAKVFFMPVEMSETITHGRFSGTTHMLKFSKGLYQVGRISTEEQYQFLYYLRESLNWDHPMLSDVNPQSLNQRLQEVKTELPLILLKTAVPGLNSNDQHQLSDFTNTNTIEQLPVLQRKYPSIQFQKGCSWIAENNLY
jgi:hypothetical protein